MDRSLPHPPVLPPLLEAAIVGDIGGTHARFARLDVHGQIHHALTLRCADYLGPEAALRDYIGRSPGGPPRAAALGVATPVTGDAVGMTNNHWRFSIQGLQTRLGLNRLLVINDFSALALALPRLTPDALQQVGGGAPVAGSAIGVIGPGTGLGVSGLLWASGRYQVLAGEGGHVTLAAQTEEESAVIAQLSRLFPHVSAERVLSGPGLSSLHSALAVVRGLPETSLSAEQITHQALTGKDELCRAALDMFCALLGTQAANLALTLGARGGIYIGGGIVPRLGDYFARSPFRQRFEEKGRFSAYLAAIPSFVVTGTQSALLGAGVALRQALDGLGGDARRTGSIL